MTRLFCFGPVQEEDVLTTTTPSLFDRQVQMEAPKTKVHERPLKLQKLRDESCRVTISETVMNIHEEEELRKTLGVMLQQDGTLYNRDDYFYTDPKTRTWKVDVELKSQTNRGNRLVDEFCREQIAEWGYRVIDFFHVSRDVVYIAMSYLDRLMKKFVLDRATYKLVATSCLVLAMKIHHSKRIFLTDIIHDLSRGEFESDDIVKMEKQILGSLQWLLHPPTPQNYIARLLIMTNDTSKSINGFNASSVCDYATFFAELSVLDYYFVTQRQCVVALACIINAMEGLGLLTERNSIADPWFFNRNYMADLIINMCKLVHHEPDLNYISYMREKLWNLFARSDEYLNIRSREKSLFKNRLEKSPQTEYPAGLSSSSSSPTSISRYPRPALETTTL